MKKITLILTVVIISLNVNAQKKDNSYTAKVENKHNPSVINAVSTYPKDSIPKVDSSDIPILSVKDINNYLQQLSQSNVFTPKEFSQFMQVLNEMIATKQKELQSNSKKK